MPNIFTYSINKDNLITNYTTNFTKFAHANEWSSEIEPEKVIGRFLFDFIDGAETEHLYQILFENCRKGKHIGPIPFRCDSPSERRWLNLFLRPLPLGAIDIITQLLKTESRPVVRALMTNIPKSESLIRICSMCKKINVSAQDWLEIEKALVRLKIFETNGPPRLTHGLCEDCYFTAISELDAD